MSVTLQELIAHIESNNCPVAMRFEPATYCKLIVSRTEHQKGIIATIQRCCQCSWGTALMIYCSSWGMNQIMGFNLYTQGYCGNIVQFINSEAEQRNAFARFLNINQLAHYSPELFAESLVARQQFALKYNGSLDYAQSIVKSLTFFNYIVKE